MLKSRKVKLIVINNLIENYNLEECKAKLRFCFSLLADDGNLWIRSISPKIYNWGYALQLEKWKILNEIVLFQPKKEKVSENNFAKVHENLIWARKFANINSIFNYKKMKFTNADFDRFKNKDKQMRSIWEIPSEEELWKRILLACSNKGDLVYFFRNE